MTASEARRAAAAPIPPQTTTMSSWRKKRNRRPSCSLSLTCQLLTSGRTSRSRAATIAMLGISVRLEPLNGPPQGVIDRHDFPSQLALRLGRTGKHFLLAHANGIDRCTRLPAKQYPCNRFIYNAGGIREYVRQFDRGRGQTSNLPQFVEDLLQGQVL